MQADIDGGVRPGVTSEESAEIKKLKAENRRLREDMEILRAATTFFAGELDPATVDHGIHRHVAGRRSRSRVDLPGGGARRTARSLR